MKNQKAYQPKISQDNNNNDQKQHLLVLLVRVTKKNK